MTKSHKLDDRTPASRGELTVDQLQQASGGRKGRGPRETPYRETQPGAERIRLSIGTDLC